MRRGIFVFVSIIFLGSCAFLLTESVDFSKLPQPIEVSESNPFFTPTAIKFTGDPSVDFGSSYVFLNKSDGGTWKALNKVYIAYSKRFLFIGHKNTVDANDPPDYLNRGAFYVFIDNNITNGKGSKGMKKLANGDSGITGSFDFLDDAQISTVGDRKFSVFIKHYRPYKYAEPTGENFKAYRFINGSIEKESKVGPGGGLAWNRYITNNVTEIAIPWSFIFGSDPEYIPDKIYLEFRIDDGAGGTKFKESDFGTNVTTTNVVSNWLELKIK
ncbi:MAG: hypothetical protein ABDH28_04990 [Brevinematia bacterium]